MLRIQRSQCDQSVPFYVRTITPPNDLTNLNQVMLMLCVLNMKLTFLIVLVHEVRRRRYCAISRSVFDACIDKSVLTISKDGELLYVSPISSRRLYRVPTSFLKVQPGPLNPNAALLARQAVLDLGEKGTLSDGMETDASGLIYLGAPGEQCPTRWY